MHSQAGWLAALVLVVGALIAVNWGWQQGDEEGVYRAEVTTHGKMILAAHAMAEIAGTVADPAPALRQMEALERTPADRVYRAIVLAEVGTGAQAHELVASVPDQTPDAAALQRLYGGGTLSEEEREGLRERLGWFGRLAAVFGLPADDPARTRFWEPVRSSARAWITLSLAAVPGFVAGVILFVLMLIKLKQGALRSRFRLHDLGSGDLPWLRMVVLGLAAVLALNLGLFAYLGVSPLIMMWLPLVPVVWPRLRRMRAAEWRGGLGVARGAGIVREMGAGVVGYLAGLPLVMLGLLVTAQLTALTGWKASHPLSYETIEGAHTPVWAIVLSACVWAPVVEECLFRGALYRYLRPHYTVVGSASISALLFAVVHPQGIVGVPAIWTLGVVFAGLREWRGSIWSSMTAHALHNGVLVLMLLTVMG